MALTKRNDVYRCGECGHIIEVLFPGSHPVCCGKPMVFQNENTRSGAAEKHVPLIERTSNGYRVTVGSIIHPMEESHYIQFIEIIADGTKHTAFLEPVQSQPIVEFLIPEAKSVIVREYCNLHGYWETSL
ncbi:MAG: desulfoferrodoxin [Desulfovibrionaceae bacterium]